MLDLRFENIKDDLVRDAIFNIVEWARLQDIFQCDYKFYEISFASAVTNYKYPHKQRSVPKDVLQTSKTGAGNVTFNYSLFDGTNLDITTTGACTVRFFAGNFAPQSQA